MAARRILAQGADVNAPAPDGTTPLHWAVHRDAVELVRLLIGAGADVKVGNRYGVTPLVLACTNGSTPVADLLLEAGADPNTASAEGETVLMTAARTGSADLVRLLIEHGADVNAKETWRGQTALMWAIAEKHLSVVRILLEKRRRHRRQDRKGVHAIPVRGPRRRLRHRARAPGCRSERQRGGR